MKVETTISRLPNVDKKSVTKEKATKELHNQGEIKRTTTRALKGRGLKIFVTIARRRLTCLEIVGPEKSLSKAI